MTDIKRRPNLSHYTTEQWGIKAVCGARSGGVTHQIPMVRCSDCLKALKKLKLNKPPEVIKLYDLPRDSKILLPIMGEDGDKFVEKMCNFRHIDGMHSLILTPEGNPVHLGASTEVKKVGDHYKLA